MNGSIICRELLGLDHKKDSPTPSDRTTEYYKKRPCKELVGDACKILDKYLEATKSLNKYSYFMAKSDLNLFYNRNLLKA